MIKRILLLITLSGILTGTSWAGTIFQHDFNNGAAGGMNLGYNWQVTSSGGKNNTGAIKLTYDQKGTPGNQGILNVSQFNTQELWIEFDTRIEGQMNGGMKFVKIFGSETTHSQNNTTFLMDYSSNALRAVSYYQDTICESRLDGNPGWNTTCQFTPVKTTSSIDLRGNTWKHVKIHFVRATPGTSNGAYSIWVDGVEKASAINVNNNPQGTSTNKIAYISFGDYTNSNNATWHFWIDNLSVSSSEGTASAPAPDPSPAPEPVQSPDPAVSNFEWSAPSYTINEGVGTATFSITRSGDSSSSASVDWGTFQDSAALNIDYSGVAWTNVTFAAGETSKQVSVAILDDSEIEGTETFTLSLNSPTNANLGAATNASVNITDNDDVVSLAPPQNLTVLD